MGSISSRNSRNFESASAAPARSISSAGEEARMATHSLPMSPRRSRGMAGAGREEGELEPKSGMDIV